MKESSVVFWHWLPRILTLLLAGFLSLFALDVFEEGNGFFKTITSLFMHLIPVWSILIVLWVAWNRPIIGAIFYPSLGIAYAVVSWGNWDWLWVITLPLMLIGFAYLLQFWMIQRKLNK